MKRLTALAIVAASIVVAPQADAQPTSGSCPQYIGTALRAGWSIWQVSTVSRIMFLESSCDPLKYNGTGPDSSHGLMQLNVKGPLLLDRLKVCNLTTVRSLWDPLTNLRCAHALYLRDGWKPWGSVL